MSCNVLFQKRKLNRFQGKEKEHFKGPISHTKGFESPHYALKQLITFLVDTEKGDQQPRTSCQNLKGSRFLNIRSLRKKVDLNEKYCPVLNSRKGSITIIIVSLVYYPDLPENDILPFFCSKNNYDLCRTTRQVCCWPKWQPTQVSREPQEIEELHSHRILKFEREITLATINSYQTAFS